MNIVEYIASSKKIVFCIVDDIDTYANSWIKETVKNIADFTISNLHTKGYNVFVGHDESILIDHALSAGYEHAVIMSPGTEFINGTDFFDALEIVVKDNFLVMGHILDRGQAYYELHHQCYILNLKVWNEIDCPFIGKEAMGVLHTQVKPNRSRENIHDSYTPLWITTGEISQSYDHRRHGWNIISQGLKHNKDILVFGEKLRNSKRHYYPESKKDFEEKISWLYHRQQYCATEFIHTKNNEWNNGIKGKFDQVIVPASGTLYTDLIDKGTVIFYDYNQNALDYWKKNISKKQGVEYKFVKTDLLNDDFLLDHINYTAKKTLINLSNIFCYEGTATVYPLAYRLYREEKLVNELHELSNVVINFTMSASCGFSDIETDYLSYLKKPTWHMNQDWNE